MRGFPREHRRLFLEKIQAEKVAYVTARPLYCTYSVTDGTNCEVITIAAESKCFA